MIITHLSTIMCLKPLVNANDISSTQNTNHEAFDEIFDELYVYAW